MTKINFNEYIKPLYEYQPGDKFYSWDGLVLVLIDCSVDMNNPDEIKYSTKLWKSQEEVRHVVVKGSGCRDRGYLPYKGRHKTS